MDRHTFKTLVKTYKEKARAKYDRFTKTRKKRHGLPLKERFELWKKDRASLARWKKQISKVENKAERRAQKKGYRHYKKLLRRKYVIATWTTVGVLFFGLIGYWYYGVTRPLTDEQQVARDHSLSVAEDVMDEGIVLLRNENSALPLSTNTVSVFGAGAAAPVYGGGGAGGIATKDVETLYEAFDEAGIAYDQGLYNVYSNYAFNGKASTKDFSPAGETLLDTFVPNIAGFMAGATDEMPVDQLPEETFSAAVRHSNTAIYVISRVGTETKDLTPEVLQLSDDERATLDRLDANFDKVVLLMNTTNAFELGFVGDYKHIDGVLWVGAPGEVGTKSIAAVLQGRVNPSGRLTDTYAYDVSSNPSVSNTGDFEYVDANGEAQGRYFANYLEDIYVGYRYYETFISDADYSSVVQYPFGYGLSYTDFSWETVDTTADSSKIEAKVKVTNTGDVAGKDVVQLYYEPPYTQGGLEKSAIVLGGYAKTGLLEPGQSEVVTVSFDTRSMASYDDEGVRAWVLDAGNYKIDISRNVHAAVSGFNYTQSSRAVFDTDSMTGNKVTNQFDDADGDLTYFSRSDAEGTYPIAPEGQDYVMPEIVPASDYIHKTTSAAEPTTGADNGIKLEDLKGLAYDDPKWDLFLDQFTADDLVHFSGDGGYWSIAIDHLGIPRTSMYDGPASIRSFLQAWASVAYPIPVNLSATWNTTLAEEVGRSMGAEAVSYNVDAVYAPSLNLHRSPLGGRNFEYYSEDPLVAGTFGAAWTNGLQSTGTVAVMKHFVANDQETHRADFGLYTWMTEQSLRELYLKPFEITAKQGHAHGVMSAFNRIGTTWAGGDRALLTNVLRKEWGFEGFVITDAGVAGQGEHFDALQAAEAGNDLMLAFIIEMPGNNTFEAQLYDYMDQDRAGTLNALRNAAHNISYYVLQTNKVD